MASDVKRYLDSIRLDWKDFEAAAEESREILAHICDQQVCLDEFVRSALADPILRNKCERHQLLDYFVIYDALDRGIRLRLHLSTSDHLQRPHDHRFDFSTRIICGFYEHCLIKVGQDPYSLSDASDALAYQDRDHPDPAVRLTNQDLQAAFVRNEAAGATYSLSHDVVHTVLTTANTVSLVLRGPARKQRSFIFDRTTEALWWRFGQKDEPAYRRQDKTMSDETLDHTVAALSDLGVLTL